MDGKGKRLSGALLVELGRNANENYMQLTSTYKAVEVSAPGVLRVVERQTPEPGVGQVRIRVEACGIYHTDAVTGTYSAAYKGRSRSKYKASSMTLEIGGERLRGRLRKADVWTSFDDQQQSNPKGKEMSVSSKPKRIGSGEPPAASTQAATGETSLGNVARDEKIRLRAYELYLERGGQPGLELDDWLQAELELQGGAL